MCGIGGWLGNLPGSDKVAKNMARGNPCTYTPQDYRSVGCRSPSGWRMKTGAVWTVFNGEIYNHRALRRNLEARGHVFKSHSDTDVLPHLYEKKGLDYVNELRGMFALAIYDTKTHTLIGPRSFRH